MNVTGADLAAWAGGRLVNAPADCVVQSVMTDSRCPASAAAFFALSGENFDGHDYVNAAFESGAIIAIVDHESALHQQPGIIVEDVLRALGAVAHRYRWTEPLVPWVGIAGSNGKTTTRTILTRILAARGTVTTSPSNFNNQIGLPLTLLGSPDDAWAGVVELGSSAPGEIAYLTRILTPTISIVTSIGAAHVAGLGDVEGVAHEKSAIFTQLPTDGLGIYPANAPYVEILRAATSVTRTTFAVESEGDFVATDVCTATTGTSFTVRSVNFHVPLLGVHNVSNCLAALIAADALGIGLAEAAVQLATLAPVAGRCELLSGGEIQILDDTYNANPDSLAAGLAVIGQMNPQRRVAIIGDMLELGDASQRLHREAGRRLGRADFACVLTIGDEAAAVADGVTSTAAHCEVKHFASMSDLTRDIKKFIHPGDLIYIKGSRGMQMERVVTALQEPTPTSPKEQSVTGE